MGKVTAIVVLGVAAAGSVVLFSWPGAQRGSTGNLPQGSLFAIESTESAPAHSGIFRFEDGTKASGIDFRHVPTRTPERYMPETMGSGVVVADFDADGAPDLLFINSGDLLSRERPAAARNRLYMNAGEGRFVDRTVEWNLPSTGYGMGAAAGDFDNDGWVDLYLTAYGGGDRLLRNTGREFVDVTVSAGIVPDQGWSTSAGFFDMDGDGDLDLFVVRYVDYTLENAIRCYANREHMYCTPLLYNALPDLLYRNEGNGTFTDVSRDLGTNSDPGKGLAAVIGDVDGDGDQDIYVANDSSRNFLLINDGTGRFEDVGRAVGVAYSETGKEEAGMGTDISFQPGHRLDIACTNFQGETTSIYRRGSRFFFREVSDAIGVGAVARARLSFGIDFFDVDNDGDEDLLAANGHIADNVATFKSGVTFEQLNTLYEALGDGRFRDITELAGPALQDVQASRGLATGDLDNDGDLDFVITNSGGQAQIGLNVTAPRGNFVSLWLEGRRANRSAIGARVVARIGERELVREVHGTSSYLSICDFRVHLGLDDATMIDELTILWPGSPPNAQVIRNLPANAFYRLIEGQEPTVYRAVKGN